MSSMTPMTAELRPRYIAAGWTPSGTAPGIEFWDSPDGYLTSFRSEAYGAGASDRADRAFRSRISERFARYKTATSADWQIPDHWPRDQRRHAEQARRSMGGWLRPHIGHERPGTIALAGDPGSGKTMMAVAMLRALVMAGETSWEAWGVGEYMAARRASMFDDSYTGPDPFEACVNARVLLLDDLGAHSRTAWETEQLFALVDRRYKRHSAGVLMLTTNAGAVGDAGFWRSLLSEKSEAGPVVARLASRLAEGAVVVPFGHRYGAEWVPLPDWRRRARVAEAAE